MRRYAQFSIRSLFVLMLAVACYCAGWQSAMWKAKRDKQEAIRKAEEEARRTLQEAASRFPILAVPQPGVAGSPPPMPVDIGDLSFPPTDTTSPSSKPAGQPPGEP